MLNFVYFVKRTESERTSVEFNSDKMPNYCKVYTQFLDYIWFYGIDEPTIVCEGKTDSIYLKAAIKARAPHFPDLVVVKDGVISIRPRFFKYSDTSALLQDLSGGTGELNNLLSRYRNRLKNFKGGAKHPVIVIVDNDSGAKHIFAHIKNLKKCASLVDGSEPFYHIYENLYVVPVPKIAKADTPIEKLFERKLLKTVWSGKTLDLTGNGDPSKYYSKSDFAIHVVKKGGGSVKFDGFDPLLTALVAVKHDYAKRLVIPTPSVPSVLSPASAVASKL